MGAKKDAKLAKRIKVKKTHVGRGVFARRAIEADAVIGEIDGQIMDAEFESDYCMDLGGKAGLEPLPPFRFLNHHCEPNCELVLWKHRKRGGKRIPRLWLMATRRIPSGEELTIDYAWPQEAGIRCLCGSASCRGWVAEAQQT